MVMDPSGDSLAALAQRAVALQPAAEAVIQAVHTGGALDDSVADDGRRVAVGYRRLRDELERLPAGPDSDDLGVLLEQHGDLVEAALRDARRPPGASPAVEGLGRAAARLVVIRDRLRRDAGVAGRRIEDLPTDDRF
jgi:hypothetical protein